MIFFYHIWKKMAHHVSNLAISLTQIMMLTLMKILYRVITFTVRFSTIQKIHITELRGGLVTTGSPLFIFTLARTDHANRWESIDALYYIDTLCFCYLDFQYNFSVNWNLIRKSLFNKASFIFFFNITLKKKIKVTYLE